MTTDSARIAPVLMRALTPSVQKFLYEDNPADRYYLFLHYRRSRQAKSIKPRSLGLILACTQHLLVNGNCLRCLFYIMCANNLRAGVMACNVKANEPPRRAVAGSFFDNFIILDFRETPMRIGTPRP